MSYIKTKAEGGNGFVIIPEEVTRDPGLTFQKMKVLLALCAHAANGTGRAAPEVETIAERTGMKRENVSRTLTALVSMGWITRQRMGHGFTNVYHITPEARLKKISKETLEKKKLRVVTSKKRSAEEQAIHVTKIEKKIADDMKRAQDRRDIADGKPEDWDEQPADVMSAEDRAPGGTQDMFEAEPTATAEEIAAWPRKRVMDVGMSRVGPKGIPDAILRHYGINPHVVFG